MLMRRPEPWNSTDSLADVEPRARPSLPRCVSTYTVSCGASSIPDKRSVAPESGRAQPALGDRLPHSSVDVPAPSMCMQVARLATPPGAGMRHGRSLSSTRARKISKTETAHVSNLRTNH